MGKKRTKPSELELAIQVARRVQLIEIQLIETAARQELKSGELPGNAQLDIQTGPKVDRKNLRILVYVRLGLSCRYTKRTVKNPPLKICATFGVGYKVSSLKGLEKKNFDAFGKLNAVYNAWPYWREYVQSIAVRMGLPPIPIPVYVLPERD